MTGNNNVAATEVATTPAGTAKVATTPAGTAEVATTPNTGNENTQTVDMPIISTPPQLRTDSGNQALQNEADNVLSTTFIDFSQEHVDNHVDNFEQVKNSLTCSVLFLLIWFYSKWSFPNWSSMIKSQAASGRWRSPSSSVRWSMLQAQETIKKKGLEQSRHRL